MICFRTRPMFAFYLGVLGNCGQLFSRLHHKTVITKFAVMLLVCFVCAALFGVPELLLFGRFCVLRDEDRFITKKGALIPLSRKMKANIMQQGLLPTIIDREVAQPFVLSPFPPARKIKWTKEKALNWHLYDFAFAVIIAVSGRKADGYENSCHGDSLSGVVHPKVISSYVE